MSLILTRFTELNQGELDSLNTALGNATRKLRELQKENQGVNFPLWEYYQFCIDDNNRLMKEINDEIRSRL